MASLESITIRVGIKPVNKPTDKVIFRVGDMEISKSARDVVHQLLAPIFKDAATPAVDTRTFADDAEPQIGSALDGGIFAGLTLDDGRPARLILLPGDEELNWKDAKAWAAKQDGMLPSRIDALVLWQNLKKEFKDTWYWTSAPFAGADDSTWVQSFDYGSQSYYLNS